MYGFLPLLALALLATGTAYAATGKTLKNNPFGTIAEAIAKKFNLATADVQGVIDETLAAQRAQMEKNRPERIDMLTQAVKDGKLTQAQADLITTKREEIKPIMASLKDMTQTEKTAAIKAQTDSLKQWAADNNIPEKYIMLFGGLNGGHGERKNFAGPESNKS